MLHVGLAPRVHTVAHTPAVTPPLSLPLVWEGSAIDVAAAVAARGVHKARLRAFLLRREGGARPVAGDRVALLGDAVLPSLASVPAERACGCGARVRARDAADHASFCGAAPDTCALCGAALARRDAAPEHWASGACAGYREACGVAGCGAEAPRGRAAAQAHRAAHVASMERSALRVRCPFASDGCAFVEPPLEARMAAAAERAAARAAGRAEPEAGAAAGADAAPGPPRAFTMSVAEHLRSGACAAARYLCPSCGRAAPATVQAPDPGARALAPPILGPFVCGDAECAQRGHARGRMLHGGVLTRTRAPAVTPQAIEVATAVAALGMCTRRMLLPGRGPLGVAMVFSAPDSLATGLGCSVVIREIVATGSLAKSGATVPCGIAAINGTDVRELPYREVLGLCRDLSKTIDATLEIIMLAPGVLAPGNI